MTLRKTTVDDSVNYILQSERTQQRDIKPNTIKNISLPRKQKRKVSQNKKFNRGIITGEGFRILERKMNCKFY